MSAGGPDEQPINDGLLKRIAADAALLVTRDEAQDVALDLHEEPFAPGVRRRVLEFIQSPRYGAAADEYTARTRKRR